MMTHMCIDATTRAAKDLGFNITLIGDACATKDLEVGEPIVKATEVQKSFLAALNDYYAIIKITDQYIEDSGIESAKQGSKIFSVLFPLMFVLS